MKIEEVNNGNQLQYMLESSNKPGAILELDGTVVQLNDLFEERFDVRYFRNIRELIDDKSVEIWDEVLKLAKKMEYSSADIMILVESTKTMIVKVKVMYDDKLKKIVAFFDIPQNYQKEAEATYINSFHKVDELKVLIDRNGIIRDVNQLCVEYFNLPKSVFVNHKVTDFLGLLSITSAGYLEHVKSAVKNGFAKFLKRYEQDSGDVRYYQITTFYDVDTLMFLMRITDQSEKMALRERLKHQDALSTVGQLAAGIAHEIRNPLTTLKGFTQLLKLSAAEDTMKYLNVIDDEINRMESILGEMLVLSKPGKNTKGLVSLQLLLSDILSIYTPKASLENVEIHRIGSIIQNDLIYGDENKLKQVLLNLLKNATEAMDLGGILTVGLIQNDENQLLITITDTGKGINSSQIKQIFTPFFTTRAEGTGLGLSFVVDTVEDHEGTVSVESNLGVGTKFTLSFPTAIKAVPNSITEGRDSEKLSIII